jgi:hypothetical protein
MADGSRSEGLMGWQCVVNSAGLVENFPATECESGSTPLNDESC